jgi:hypothetical protein
MKIQCKSVIGTPILDLNSQCVQCCFRDIRGPDTCLPYPWYQCHPDIQFKKSKCEVFKL